MESIIVAFITGGFAFAATIIANSVNHSKTLYRLEQLEKKQDKHNSVVERVYALEKGLGILEESQKVANHRIEDIEGDLKDM